MNVNGQQTARCYFCNRPDPGLFLLSGERVCDACAPNPVEPPNFRTFSLRVSWFWREWRHAETLTLGYVAWQFLKNEARWQRRSLKARL